VITPVHDSIRAGIRRKRAGQQVEQRGLAGAVRADNPDAVSPHDPHREIPRDQMIAIGYRGGFRQFAPSRNHQLPDLGLLIKAVIAMARDIATAVDSAGLLRRLRRRWRKWRSDKGKDGVS
jgi:hypothetical protein